MKRQNRDVDDRDFAPNIGDLVEGVGRLAFAWARAGADAAFVTVRIATDMAADKTDAALDDLSGALRRSRNPDRGANTRRGGNEDDQASDPSASGQSAVDDSVGPVAPDFFGLRSVADAITRAADTFATAYQGSSRRVARRRRAGD